MLKQFFRRPRRSRDRDAAALDSRAEELARTAQTLQRLADELEHAARGVCARIDARQAELERAIQRADERLEWLSARQTERPSDPDRPCDPRPLSPGGLPAPAVSEPDPSSELHTAKQPPSADANRRALSPDAPADAGAVIPAPKPPAPLAHARSARIFSLRDSGRPPLDIAESLHMPLGEVELLLALRESGDRSAFMAQRDVDEKPGSPAVGDNAALGVHRVPREPETVNG